MRRVSIVGNSGAGKTSLARRLAGALDVPHVELDSIFHQPGWNELPRDEFRRRVGDAIAADGWVVDGNYSAVRDLVWQAADTVVFLDLPRRVVMGQLIRRTVSRSVTREELWNGNREPPLALFHWDPTKNLVRWAWTNHQKYADRYRAAPEDPTWAHLTFVELRSRAAVDAFVAAAGRAA